MNVVNSAGVSAVPRAVICATTAASLLLLALAPPAWAQAAAASAAVEASGTVAPGAVVVVGDAIPQALTVVPGDAARGRAIVTNRQTGLCLLCHSGPFPEERFQGDLAPTLAGAGSRSSIGQLRLRIVDASRVNPASIMPSYYKLGGLQRVAPNWQGKTILSAQQVEDVVAFLATLRQ
jgi:sulfur-oxidizing protein SoxX